MLLLAIGGYFLLSLATFSPIDPGWAYVGARGQPENMGGPAGAWFSSVLFTLIGNLAYLFPIMIGWSGWLLFRERNDDKVDYHLLVFRWFGFFLTVAAGSGLAAMHFPPETLLPEGPGGIL